MKANLLIIKKLLNLKFKIMLQQAFALANWFRSHQEAVEQEEETLGALRTMRKVWDKVPDIFTIRKLQKLVNSRAEKNYMDSTISRRLRQLKKNGEIGYKCLDIKRGLYRKLH